ncbi:hypothetical protein C2845_PM04G13860 [Panicum miliaceum]|uniref:Uncharacterized protein n=1 Tax=Panicum miliaceum TaxID=4540 RepID=A0A3L6QQC4_PANMI|nr:hypothetical protein C2845_PM04G13860 [Panicum miliaceum]
MVIYLFPLRVSSELGGHDMPVMDMEDVLNKYVEDVMDYWEPGLLKSRHPPKFRCGCGRVASRCTIGERCQQRKCLCCQVCANVYAIKTCCFGKMVVYAFVVFSLPLV